VLPRAELLRCEMEAADLRQSSLRGSDLAYASLRSANLRQSDLTGVNLFTADLEDAEVGSDLTTVEHRSCVMAQERKPRRSVSNSAQIRRLDGFDLLPHHAKSLPR
jgi:hypothetical protein